MLSYLAIWGAAVGTVGLVMAFARTGPDEARSKLAEWAKFFRLNKLANFLNEHALDARVLRYGKWLMPVLLFAGGMIFQGWLNTPLTTQLPSGTVQVEEWLPISEAFEKFVPAALFKDWRAALTENQDAARGADLAKNNLYSAPIAQDDESRAVKDGLTQKWSGANKRQSAAFDNLQNTQEAVFKNFEAQLKSGYLVARGFKYGAQDQASTIPIDITRWQFLSIDRVPTPKTARGDGGEVWIGIEIGKRK